MMMTMMMINKIFSVFKIFMLFYTKSTEIVFGIILSGGWYTGSVIADRRCHCCIASITAAGIQVFRRVWQYMDVSAHAGTRVHEVLHYSWILCGSNLTSSAAVENTQFRAGKKQWYIKIKIRPRRKLETIETKGRRFPRRITTSLHRCIEIE